MVEEWPHRGVGGCLEVNAFQRPVPGEPDSASCVVVVEVVEVGAAVAVAAWAKSKSLKLVLVSPSASKENMVYIQHTQKKVVESVV